MARHRVDEIDHDTRRRPGRSGPDFDQDITDGIDESQFDDVADLICIGRGPLGVAVAAAARRAGLDVASAAGPSDTAGRDTGYLDGRLGVDDEETVAYLRALTEDVTPLPEVDPLIPTRLVDGPRRPARAGDRLETFFGIALRDWAMACVASRHGVLYTRVADPELFVSYTGADGPVEATVLDSIDVDPERPAESLQHWLSVLGEGDRRPASETFERLLFDDGRVVGAVLGSAEGEHSVGARHGVMLCLGEGLAAAAPGAELDLRETAAVALVSRPASRFARLEFLAGELH